MKGGGRRAAAVPAVLLLIALLPGAASPSFASGRKKKRRHPRPAPAANFDVKLPVLGTRVAEFPEGGEKAIADAACLTCHSASMTMQQRLTEKQWTAEVDRMIGWGAVVPPERRDELIAYLAKNFGPDNDRFEPVITRPVGR